MADVAATLAGWSSTTGSNAPSGGTTIGTGLDDNLREIQGVIVRGLSHKGADIASATTTDLGAIEGLAHDITGTTTITGFGTVRAGIWKVIKFEGALTLTHNATSLILPGAANITTADGDTAIVISEGSGNWRCVAYVKANGKPIAGASGAITSSDFTMSTARLLGRTTASTGAIEEITVGSDLTLAAGAISVAPASDTLAGKIEIATTAEMETGTSTTLAVTPGRQQYHPASPKAFTLITVSGGTPTSTIGYNVSSITDGGTGDFTINFTTAFSTANYGFVFGQETDAGTATYIVTVNYDTAPTASAIRVANLNIAGAAATDPRVLSAAFFGDY